MLIHFRTIASKIRGPSHVNNASMECCGGGCLVSLSLSLSLAARSVALRFSSFLPQLLRGLQALRQVFAFLSLSPLSHSALHSWLLVGARRPHSLRISFALLCILGVSGELNHWRAPRDGRP